MTSHEDFLEDLFRAWENDAVVIRTDELPHHILEAIARHLNDLDDDINEVHKQRFIESATEGHLDEIGRRVNVYRNTDEDDESFRIRVQAGYARALSDTTFETFASIVLNVLNTNPDAITITGDDSGPIAVVNTPLPVIEDTPLSQDEISSELKESVPMGHGVRIEGTGTFELGGPDYTPSSNSGLNEGTLGSTFDTS